MSSAPIVLPTLFATPSASPPSGSAAAAQSRSGDSRVSSLATAHSGAVEVTAAVAFLQLVHDAFPTANLMSMRETLAGRDSIRIANRNFAEADYGESFRVARETFVTQTLRSDRWPSAPPLCSAAGQAGCDALLLDGKYTSTAFESLEADCIVKLPLVDGCMREWTKDPTKGAAAARLVCIAPIERQQLPERSCPSASAAPTPAATGSGIAAPHGRASESSRFSALHYPAGAAAYVVAEVYAPLAGDALARQAQKLLQAERLLQFLVAKQRVASVRDAVLGFIFMGPRMDAAGAARLFATLYHYRGVLPCLWALQASPDDLVAASPELQPACRLFGFQTVSAHPAILGLELQELASAVTSLRDDVARLLRVVQDERAERLERERAERDRQRCVVA